jgi:O-antigen ligase
VDLPVRETSLFLVAVLFAVAWARGQRKQAIAWPAALCLLWLPLHFYAAGNGTEEGIHLKDNMIILLNPVHWPQIASALGFLMIPLILARRRLSKVQQAFLLGAAPCIVVTLAFGKWIETRIFNEWLLSAAVLLATEIWDYFTRSPLGLSEDVAPAEN